VDSILEKHDAATNARRFNAQLATGSINDAIEYYELFKETQEKRAQENEDFSPLNVACVFSPPAEGNKDVQQIQEDLPQEKADNEQEPDKKKEALKAIIADYNKQYGTNHRINEFDLYYQDVQKRIKDHKYSNADYPHKNKIDVVIVVDMLLTGFDSKYLNTLYVDKNLKQHGLIQAFSRTNRVLNDTKPYGNILDFRQQAKEVDEAIALFSGQDKDKAKEIWLVDSAPVVIEKYKEAIAALDGFMTKSDLVCEPKEVYNLKGDTSRINFINQFKEIQRLKTQLDQYTDLSVEQKNQMEALISEDKLRSFRSSYLEIAQRLKEKQQKDGNNLDPDVAQLYIEVHTKRAKKAENEPGTADQPARLQHQFNGGAGRYYRLYQHLKSRRRVKRKRDKRGLPAIQGRKSRQRNGRGRREARTGAGIITVFCG